MNEPLTCAIPVSVFFIQRGI